MKDYNKPLAPEDPVSSKVFIDKILSKFKIDLDSSQSQLAAQWNIVLGSMAQLCSFVSLKNGILTVSCPHPAKASVVRMNKNEIIKSIKGVFPELEIRQLTVKTYNK